MSVSWLVAAVLLVPATWIAALAHAVKSVSRSSLVSRLAGGPRSDLAHWFVEHVEAAHVGLSLVRTLLRIGIVAAVVLAVTTPTAVPLPVEVADPGAAAPPAAPETAAPEGYALTVPELLLAVVVSAVAVWFSTVVIASALARAAGEGLVASGLRTIRVLAVLAAPMGPIVRVTNESVRRLAGAEARDRDESEAELLRSIEEQQRGGGLDPQAASMLENIVWFNQTDVGEVMTPRTDIDGIEYTDELSEIRALIDEHGHSRMPVFEDNLDHILGILYVKDLVPYLGADASDFRLRPLLREPKFVPETKPVNELLQDFQRSEVHMAIVVDEYGGTAGVVTIEDVLEEIVGEIQDEHDTDHEDLPTLDELEDGLVEVDGRYHIDDLNEALALDLPEDAEYDTVAGFVLARLGRVPDVGEGLSLETARITVLEATSTVIERLRIEYGARARREIDPEAPDLASESDAGFGGHGGGAGDEAAASGARDDDGPHPDDGARAEAETGTRHPAGSSVAAGREAPRR